MNQNLNRIPPNCLQIENCYSGRMGNEVREKSEKFAFFNEMIFDSLKMGLRQ